MPINAIRASAEALASALEDSTTGLSAAERDALRDLQAKLAVALVSEEPPPAEELSGVVDRAVAALGEASPEATAVLGRLAETLSELGI